MNLPNVNHWYEKVQSESGKTRPEIQLLVTAKQEKFSGLLTESGALFLVSKELGVNLNSEQHLPHSKDHCLISELREGDLVEEIKGIIVTIYPARPFEKNGKQGQVQNVLVKDDSGQISLVLWNEQVNQLLESQASGGDSILLEHVTVKSRTDQLQLHLQKKGLLKITKGTATVVTKMGDLKAEQSALCVEGFLSSKYPSRTFQNDRGSGQLTCFTLSDETGVISGVAWNDAALQLELMEKGSKIRLDQVYTKVNQNGKLELHAGFSSRISLLEKGSSSTITSIESVLPGSLVQLTGKIKELDVLRATFDVCGQCGGKASTGLCAKCGPVSMTKKAIAKFVLSDESGKEVNVIVFGLEAEKVWKIKAMQLAMLGVEEVEEMAKGINSQLIQVSGKAQVNSFNQELEIKGQQVKMIG